MVFKPYEYQKYCIDRCISDDKLALFLDMGLGKTVITLTALNDMLNNSFSHSRALIIAPKRVAESTWEVEASKWEHLTQLKLCLLSGTEKERMAKLKTKADVYIISRDLVNWLFSLTTLSKEFFDIIVVDELSSFKNPSSVRFKALKRFKPKKIIGLTGTPSPNGYLDLWSQIFLLDKGERLGTTITKYRQTYFIANKIYGTPAFKYELIAGAEKEIKKRISDICVSMKSEDYLQLPELIEHDIYIDFSKSELKQYKELEKEYLLSIDEEEISVVNAAALSNKLLQLCSGAVYTEGGGYTELNTAKLDALKDLIETEEQMLIFYNFVHDKERILKLIPDAIELKDGKTIKDWNEGKIKYLLAHPQSAGYGLNLQAGGHHIVFFGLCWSVELYQQAIKRLHRQGQDRPVFVHRLLARGLRDEDVAKALKNKAEAQNILLDSLKARIKEAKFG